MKDANIQLHALFNKKLNAFVALFSNNYAQTSIIASL